jgi:selenocysteine-specific elongation factor
MEGARQVVIGTAGHVDHGKTTLTRALTGIDTDRLKEEKERALSIDLGFAPLTLPGGRAASVVDVPGHERFIKNMVAGVTGMDVVVLVIAADEGVMPQTREHLDIVTLLDVSAGLVALTKIDMVEPDWLSLMKGEVAESLKGTPFEGVPIVPCSGVTGEGVEELRERLGELAEEAVARDSKAPLMLAVDRVFVMKGFGTIVTGTVSRGRAQVGDEVEILPHGRRSRVRSIQVHGSDVPEALAGHRAALNLQGVTAEEVARGDVIAHPGSLSPSSMLDVSLRVLEHAAAPLEYWDRVRVHLGTSEVIGRVVLLGEAQALAPGESGFVQLRLESPVATTEGAHCVLRTYSPARTFAGGQVVDPTPPKHRGRARRAVAQDLEARREGSPDDLLDRAIAAMPGPAPTVELLSAAALHDTEENRDLIDARLEDGRLVGLHGGLLASAESVRAAEAKVAETIGAFHHQHPLRAGVDRGEIRRRLGALPSPLARAALERLIASGQVVALDSDRVRMASHTPALDDRGRAAAEALLAAAKAEEYLGIEPQAAESLDYPAGAELIQYWVESGDLVRVGDRYLHSGVLERARGIIVDLLRGSDGVKISEIRDALDSSRKAVVPLMEHFDQVGVTRRRGDERIAGPNA